MKVRKFVKRTEFYLAVIIIILAMLIEMRSGQFFTGNNLVAVSYTHLDVYKRQVYHSVINYQIILTF